jgi:hypothetical protein
VLKNALQKGISMKEDRGREDALEAEGWTRQFVANEPRLSEAAELYRELGLEVLLEPLPETARCDDCEGEAETDKSECRVCYQGVEDQYRVIFTRPPKKEEGEKGRR